MSKNFEFLKQAAQEELFVPEGLPTPLSGTVPASLISERLIESEISKLAQRLFLGPADYVGPKVVAFSGIARDNRSSWICARAAKSLSAQTDSLVCVVDANFRSPQLHIHFGVSNLNGLANGLTAEGSIRRFATPVCHGNLWLIPTGPVKENLYAQTERCRTCFTELQKEFSYILISAPPLCREAEATLMGQMADGIVLIVEANQTRRDTVRRAKEQLEATHVQLLGGVLDQRTFPIPEFLYRRL